MARSLEPRLQWQIVIRKDEFGARTGVRILHLTLSPPQERDNICIRGSGLYLYRMQTVVYGTWWNLSLEVGGYGAVTLLIN
jgi:hypothetical protein